MAWSNISLDCKNSLLLAISQIADLISPDCRTRTIRITVSSMVPTGAGLGSSASLCVGVSVCLMKIFSPFFLRKNFKVTRYTWYRTVFDAAMEGERIFHKNPSGFDVYCVLFGGFIVAKDLNSKILPKNSASSAKWPRSMSSSPKYSNLTRTPPPTPPLTSDEISNNLNRGTKSLNSTLPRNLSSKEIEKRVPEYYNVENVNHVKNCATMANTSFLNFLSNDLILGNELKSNEQQLGACKPFGIFSNLFHDSNSLQHIPLEQGLGCTPECLLPFDRFERIEIDHDSFISNELIIIDSNLRKSSTSSLVTSLEISLSLDPNQYFCILEKITEASKSLIYHLKNKTLMKNAFQNIHRFLIDLGVSTSRLDTICRSLDLYGYDAKLTGAGGGGHIIALPRSDCSIKNLNDLQATLQSVLHDPLISVRKVSVNTCGFLFIN